MFKINLFFNFSFIIAENSAFNGYDKFFSKLNQSGRVGRLRFCLPEKGNIVNVPYDLIDMLWDMIESIISSNSSSKSSDDVKSQVQALINKRSSMEKALEKHFDIIKTNEEGLKSARVLS